MNKAEIAASNDAVHIRAVGDITYVAHAARRANYSIGFKRYALSCADPRGDNRQFKRSNCRVVPKTFYRNGQVGLWISPSC